MQILIIHQYFYPEIAGSAIRLTDVATGLAQRGHQVTVYTGLSNYTGKQMAPRKEIYQGVKIHRLDQTRFGKQIVMGRMLNSITFFVAAFLRALFTNPRALLLIGSDPPFLCIMGCWLKKLRGQKYILRIADVYPDIAVRLGYLKQSGCLERLWSFVNRTSFAHADKVITLGERMRGRLSAYFSGRADDKVAVIEDWEDASLVHPIPKQENWFAKKYGLSEKLVVLYSGNLGLVPDLERVVQAADLLRDETDIVLAFIGDGNKRDSLQALARQKGLRNTLFLPYQRREDLAFSLACGDVALISMRSGTEGLCIPCKVYTALASGSAILGVVSEETEIADLINRYRCGIHVPPGSPEEIAQAILALHRDRNRLHMYQKNAHRCFMQRFTKERAVASYEALFRLHSNEK